MRRLSIFNSDTWQARLWPAPWMLVLAVLLVAAELVLRAPVLNATLPSPEPTLWHATNVQAKLDDLQALQAGNGIDVLFIGNSTVLAGVDPEVFDRARGSTATGPVSFNGALEGIPAAAALDFVKVYLRYVRPSVIIYGITAQDLNDNSPTGRSVAAKVQQAPRVIAAVDEGPRGRALGWLLDHSTLFRYRTVLYHWLLNGEPDPAPTIYFDERGFVDSDVRLSDVPPSERGGFYNNDGVLAYDPRGDQAAALRELAAYVRLRGSELVLVNMPLADDYYGNFASAQDYPAYLDALTAIAAQTQAPVWNMEADPKAPPITDAGFADFNHLNRFGAGQLSAALAERFAVWSQAIAQERSAS